MRGGGSPCVRPASRAQCGGAGWSRGESSSVQMRALEVHVHAGVKRRMAGFIGAGKGTLAVFVRLRVPEMKLWRSVEFCGDPDASVPPRCFVLRAEALRDRLGHQIRG